ncbi:MAG: biopolymer transporter ExbD [Bacteriovoracaceae bacterium]|nr:biopolymer transporter ExbD [Bacteriovoracaceae bacterium]
MGFSLNNKKGAPISEINVTPLVDVMLVLLVIFMISAPLMFSGINLDLPKTKKVNTLKITNTQVVLSFSPGLELYLGDQKVLREELIPEIKALFKEHNTQVVYLRADYEIQYGHVAKLMAFLKHGGISQIALVTENEK